MKILLLLLILFGCDNNREVASRSSVNCIETFKSFLSYKTTSKRFNEVFLDYTPLKKNSFSVGIENEFLVPSDLGRRGVVDLLEEEIKKANPSVEIKREYFVERVLEYEDYGLQYDVHQLSYSVGGERKIWKITPESIWSVPFDTEICEVSSPIMKSKREIDFYTQFIKKLADQKGARSYIRGGAVHYHYGVPDLSQDELKLFLFAYRSLNGELSHFFQKNSARIHALDLSTWDSILTPYFRDSSKNIFDEQLIVTQKKSIFRFDEDYGTIEQRLVNSTMEPRLIKAGLDLHQKLIDAIRSQSPPLLDYLAKCYSDGIDASLERVAEIIGWEYLGDRALVNIIDKGI